MRNATIWIHDLAGERVGALTPRGGLREIVHDERLDESETLSFELPADSSKAELVEVDREIRWEGRRFTIREIEDLRSGSATVKVVRAEALWYRLGDRTRVGSTQVVAATPKEGLDQILEGSGWTAGLATASTGSTFSIEEEDATVLDLVRTWAKVVRGLVVFSTDSKIVDIVSARGVDRGLGFRYGRNVTGIRRRVSPPEVTVLYPYGADDLSVSGINGGVPYVEDFSFYTDQGLSIDEARARYWRSRVWSDTTFLTDVELLAAAEERLAELAAPIISYEIAVVDLSEQSGVPEVVSVGDRVRVYDPSFGDDVRTTVVRVARHPVEPWRNEIELSHLQSTDGLGENAPRSSRSAEWVQIVGPTGTNYKIRNDGTWITNRIPLVFRERGRAHFSLDLGAVGVGVGTFDIEILDSDGATGETTVFRTLSIPYTDGEAIAARLSWAVEDLSGVHDYRVRATTTADGGPDPANGVDVVKDLDGEAAFWAMAQGAVRQVAAAANSERFEYTGAVQTFTVPDGVTEVEVEVAGSVGGAEEDQEDRAGGGGVISGKFYVTPGDTYDVIVGGGEESVLDDRRWPDGGHGDSTTSVQGGDGGGSSSFYLSGGSFADSVIVAPGGGGAGFCYASTISIGGGSRGGDGGLFNGGDSVEGGANLGGLGATQYAGGAPGSTVNGDGVAGSFGAGGDAGDTTNSFAGPGGGGGGGWYGGGGAGVASANGVYGEGGGGGGGSGWVDPAVSEVTVSDGGNRGLGYVEFRWETPTE